MSDQTSTRTALLICWAIISVMFVAGIAWVWYSAGIRQAAYERQGIYVTRWECFVDAHPATAVRP